MEFLSFEHWDEELWKKASFLYNQAFQGAKPEKVIRNMFEKKLCFLHLAIDHSKVVAMALTGRLKESRFLIIDYLTVLKDCRNQGIGIMFVEYLKDWAITNEIFNSMIIEVESDNGPENMARIHFWEKCGFHLTDYIHQYIWVPEPYQAMYIKLTANTLLPNGGEQLFEYISRFHKESFQGC
jgi:GNAT superfamily N-acetyltransferase